MHEQVEVTAQTIRPDFFQSVMAHLRNNQPLKYPACTYAEAAQIVGLTCSTVERWLAPSRALKGKMRFSRFANVGAYVVDVASFIEYWRTGEPQGPSLKSVEKREDVNV